MVAVIGGGIGGLTAAIALQRRGIEVQVYESAPALLEVGAGIWIPPNAMQVFDQLGLASAVMGAGSSIERIELVDSRSGLLKELDLRPLIDRLGHPIVGIERSTLQRILVEALAPGTLHLDHEFVHYTEDPAGRVYPLFRGGGSPDDVVPGTLSGARLLVGADGLRSRVRAQLFPYSSPRYSGQSTYRALVSMELPVELEGRSREVWGAGRRFGLSAVGDGRVSWYASWDARPGERDGPGELAERLEWLVAGLASPIREAVEGTRPEDLVRTDLYDLRPLRSWHRGRVVLLGDAAHASTPNLGQGGAQAIEDAYVLALVLAEGGFEGRPLSSALRRYEAQRFRKANRLLRQARLLGKVGHWSQPVVRAVRNLVLRVTPSALIRWQLGSVYTVRAIPSPSRSLQPRSG